jgi:hypothetical protein
MLILGAVVVPQPMAWPDDLREVLAGAGFLGAPLNAGNEPVFCMGDAFLDHIGFLGCSPVVHRGIEAEGAQGTETSPRVRLARPSQQLRFVSGVEVAPPRCPRCRHAACEWRALVEAWERDQTDYRWRCPGCGTAARLEELDWRHRAGFGRLFLEVLGIHPFEAVPQERLLRLLGHYSKSPWGYFYTPEGR